MKIVFGVTPDEERRQLDEAAEIIAGWPRVWARLLAEHVIGPDGRCRGCPRGNTVAPHWPCTLAGLAGHARRLHTTSAGRGASAGAGRGAPTGPTRGSDQARTRQ